MKKSKGMQLGAVLAAMLLVGMAFVTVASAKSPAEDIKIKNAKETLTNKSSASGFLATSDGSGVSILSGVTYNLDVTITGVKDSGNYWYNLYGDSTATASANIDYIQASGTLTGPTLTANYGPVGHYNSNLAVASGTLTDYYFWRTTYQNQGHGMYRINGVNYYLDATASITTPP